MITFLKPSKIHVRSFGNFRILQTTAKVLEEGQVQEEDEEVDDEVGEQAGEDVVEREAIEGEAEAQ